MGGISNRLTGSVLGNFQDASKCLQEFTNNLLLHRAVQLCHCSRLKHSNGIVGEPTLYKAQG